MKENINLIIKQCTHTVILYRLNLRGHYTRIKTISCFLSTASPACYRVQIGGPCDIWADSTK